MVVVGGLVLLRCSFQPLQSGDEVCLLEDCRSAPTLLVSPSRVSSTRARVRVLFVADGRVCVAPNHRAKKKLSSSTSPQAKAVKMARSSARGRSHAVRGQRKETEDTNFQRALPGCRCSTRLELCETDTRSHCRAVKWDSEPDATSLGTCLITDASLALEVLPVSTRASKRDVVVHDYRLFSLEIVAIA